MYRKFSGLGVALVLGLVLIVAPVYAQGDIQEDVSASSDQDNTEVGSRPEDESQGSDTSAEKQAARDARLKEYKLKAEERLTEFQSSQIARRCSAAQTKIAALQKSDEARIEARIAVYERIVNKVSVLVERLQKSGLDTSTLETALEDMQIESDALSLSLRAYVMVLSDLAELDCEADTETFQAALIRARESRVSLKTQTEAFRSFVKDDIKTILQDLRSQLESETEEQ